MKFDYQQVLDAVIRHSDSLQATDFDPDLRVVVALDDGSRHEWISAFYLEVEEEFSGEVFWLAVFAEHDHCHLFAWDDIVFIRMYRKIPQDQYLLMEEEYDPEMGESHARVNLCHKEKKR